MNRRAARLAVLVAVVAMLALRADGEPALPPDLAQVPGGAAVVVSLRPAMLWDHALAKALRGKMAKEAKEMADAFAHDVGLPLAEVERVTLVVDHLGRGANPITFVAATKPFDRKKLLDALVPTGIEKERGGKKYVVAEQKTILILDDKHFVEGQAGAIESLIDAGKTKADAAMMPALKLAAGKHAAVVALNPQSLGEFGDELLGGVEELKPLLKAKQATLTLDASPLSASLRVTFPGDDEAKAGAKAVEAARKLMVEVLADATKRFGKMGAMTRLLGQLGKDLQAAEVKRDGAVVSASAELKMDDKALLPLVDGVTASLRDLMAWTTDANNLKQLGLALHNYHDTNGTFPPQALHDKDGKALLSWRVLILPYIEQDDLYKEFKLNEAWDSPHNKKLIAKMPPTYRHPTAKPKHEFGTFYQVIHGKGAAFEGKSGLKLTSFADGTSNTLLAASAAEDVPWTKPADLAFDAAGELPKLGDFYQGGRLVLFADGSARVTSPKLKPETWRAILTRAGGEAINDENY